MVSLTGTLVSKLGQVCSLSPGAEGADRERDWFLSGRLKIDTLVPSSGTFTRDRKPHLAEDDFCLWRPGNQLKWFSSSGARSLQKRAALQTLRPGL